MPEIAVDKIRLTRKPAVRTKVNIAVLLRPPVPLTEELRPIERTSSIG